MALGTWNPSWYRDHFVCMCPTNERYCYIVMLSPIGWAHTQNDPCGIDLVILALPSFSIRTVYSILPSDTIRQHRSGWTLVQVMARCLTAPSHYLNQCWILMSAVLLHLQESYFAVSALCTIMCEELKNYTLTHWGRVTHICISKLTIIGWDKSLSPGWHQAIIWTDSGILLTGHLGTNFNEILIKSFIFSFKKMHLKLLSAKWRPFWLGLNVLTHCGLVTQHCLR